MISLANDGLVYLNIFGCQPFLRSCPPSLLRVLFLLKPSLWPGSKSMARKKHRRGKNSARRSCLASAEWGGPPGRPAGRPYIGILLFSEKERPARPVQETICAHGFSAQRPCFRAGHGL